MARIYLGPRAAGSGAFLPRGCAAHERAVCSATMTSRSVAFAALLLSGLAGCGGDRACIAWGAHEGACPSREEAIDFMTTPNQCGERVVSVDSDPEQDQ